MNFIKRNMNFIKRNAQIICFLISIRTSATILDCESQSEKFNGLNDEQDVLNNSQATVNTGDFEPATNSENNEIHMISKKNHWIDSTPKDEFELCESESSDDLDLFYSGYDLNRSFNAMEFRKSSSDGSLAKQQNEELLPSDLLTQSSPSNLNSESLPITPGNSSHVHPKPEENPSSILYFFEEYHDEEFESNDSSFDKIDISEHVR